MNHLLAWVTCLLAVVGAAAACANDDEVLVSSAECPVLSLEAYTGPAHTYSQSDSISRDGACIYVSGGVGGGMYDPEPRNVTVGHRIVSNAADTLTIALINAREDPAEALLSVEARAELPNSVAESTVIRVARYRGRRGIEYAEIPRG